MCRGDLTSTITRECIRSNQVTAYISRIGPRLSMLESTTCARFATLYSNSCIRFCHLPLPALVTVQSTRGKTACLTELKPLSHPFVTQHTELRLPLRPDKMTHPSIEDKGAGSVRRQWECLGALRRCDHSHPDSIRYLLGSAAWNC
jgi:hypothetical protein